MKIGTNFCFCFAFYGDLILLVCILAKLCWNLYAPLNLQGWTLYEVLRYAPEHNWTAYEAALKEHPVLSKMVISGIVYSVGDWIAQVSILVLLFCLGLCWLWLDDHVSAWKSLSVMKGSLCSSLTGRGCLGPALLGSHSMDPFPITTTNSVRCVCVCGWNVLKILSILLFCGVVKLLVSTGSIPFQGLVGGPCQSCIWPNRLVGCVEQHLLCGAGILARWIPGENRHWTESNVCAFVDCKNSYAATCFCPFLFVCRLCRWMV